VSVTSAARGVRLGSVRSAIGRAARSIACANSRIDTEGPAMDSRTSQAAQRAGTESRTPGADGEIRTLTDEDLNLVPLPLGYVGDAVQDTDRRTRDRLR